MSQEQPPIRSRRELRQARDERQEVNPGTGTTGAGAFRLLRQRAARQAPALDRAARMPAFSARPEEPTEAETSGRRRVTGPVDAVQSAPRPAVLADPRPRPGDPAHHQGARREGRPAVRRGAAHAPPTASPATGRGNGPRHLGEPDRSDALAAHPFAPRGPAGLHGAGLRGAAAPARRRLLRAPGRAAGAPGSGGKLPDGMSVEQALAARELLAEQARNQAAKMEHIAATDPDAVNPKSSPNRSPWPSAPPC